MRSSKNLQTNYTVPETNTWHLKIGPGPKRKRSSSNHWYSGAKMSVSGRISAQFTFCGSKEFNALVVALAFWKSPGQNQITKNKASWYVFPGVIILPTQTMHYVREIPQNYHTFALFDSPQNGFHLMIPVFSGLLRKETTKTNRFAKVVVFVLCLSSWWFQLSTHVKNMIVKLDHFPMVSA